MSSAVQSASPQSNQQQGILPQGHPQSQQAPMHPPPAGHPHPGYPMQHGPPPQNHQYPGMPQHQWASHSGPPPRMPPAPGKQMPPMPPGHQPGPPPGAGSYPTPPPQQPGHPQYQQHPGQSGPYQGPPQNGGDNFAPPPPNSLYPFAGGIPHAEVKFTPMQAQQIRAQILAYQKIAQGRPIPDSVMQVFAKHRAAYHMHYGAPPPWKTQPPPGAPDSRPQTPSQAPQPPTQASTVPPPNAVATPVPVMAVPQRPVPNGPPAPEGPPPPQPQQQQQISEFRENVGVLNQRPLNKITKVAVPCGIDPLELKKEREEFIKQRMIQRMQKLSEIRNNVPQEFQLKVNIEFGALKLLDFQKQVRSDIINVMRRDSTFENGFDPLLYRKPRKIGLREARVTEKLEKQQKQDQERKRKLKHQEYLTAILQHAKEFKDFHRGIVAKISKFNKAVATHHANYEKEQKREQERIEKLRMKRLLEEDEEGYRKLVDQKKDKRLAFLLEQTDEYINNLISMVQQHKEDQRKKNEEKRKIRRKKKKPEPAPKPESEADETSQTELRVNVLEEATGNMLKGAEAPLASDLETWLAEHPGWAIAPKDETSGSGAVNPDEESEWEEVTDDEEGNGEATGIVPSGNPEDDEYKGGDYYTIAHCVRERISEQASIMKNGKLKQYQIHGLEWMVSLYNNNLNGILADEMGLGKTIQTISLLTYLIEKKKNNGPYLIIVPLSVMSNWVLELNRWAPSVIQIAYKGKNLI